MTFTFERTKLAIRHIPPALCEDEFRELIAEWIEKTDYFSFFAGKVFKDAYGKILQKETPTYGCAHLNFKRAKDLLRFFREFNGKVLTDSCGFKAKLLIDFALLQQVPDSNYAKPNPACGTYLSSYMYQQFLQKYPEFAAKSPQQDFDLDNPDLSLLSPLRTPIENEMEKVIDFAAGPEAPLIGPKFVDIVKAEAKKLVGYETPLTAYILKKVNERRKERSALQAPNEKDPMRPKSRYRERQRADKESQYNPGQSKPEPKPEQRPNNATNSKSKTFQTQANQSNVAPPKNQKNIHKNKNGPKPAASQQPPTPKNAPKILARKPALAPEQPPAAVAPEPVQSQAPNKAKPKTKPAKKDSIKALLNSENSASNQASTAPIPKPKRVFTTAVKKQEKQ